MPAKLKILSSIVIFIFLLVAVVLLSYGIWSVNHSKTVSNNTKSKVFLESGIITIILGGSMLAIFLFIVITIGLYIFAKNKNIL
jgi:hypothetical protein